MEVVISKITDLISKYNKEVIYSEQFRETVIEQVIGLENRTFSNILYLRYIDGMSMLKISNMMNYSEDWVKHLHGFALDAFEKEYLKK